MRFVAAIVWERRRALCTVTSGVGAQPRQRFTHADHGIVQDDAVVREPVAVEQVRRCRAQVLVRFETLGTLTRHPATDYDWWAGCASWGSCGVRAGRLMRSVRGRTAGGQQRTRDNGRGSA